MRIPLTVMEQWAAVTSIRNNGDISHVEEDKRYDWSEPLRQLGIPTVDFHLDDGHFNPRTDVLPGELVCQLIGQKLRYPMVVSLEGKAYILCNLQGGNVMRKGGTFRILADIGLFVQLAETKYFDLTC